MSDKEKQERPEAYPKPTETDTQMKNQDEYTERQSSRTSEDMPLNNTTERNSERVRTADDNARD